MYAAAGGASCRNARRRQAQQALKDKQAAQRAAKEKLAQSKANLVATPTKSKQFHQLPANYLRTPYGNMRKMSAGYTTSQGGSKLLLPINEQSAQHHSPSHQQLSSTHKQQHHHTHTPMHNREMRLDVGHKTLTKSATASFPLVSQASTPPGTPTAGIHLCPFHHPQQFKESQANLLSVQVPNEGGIIITPATPLPSPSPSDKRDQPVMISMNDLRESKAPPLVDDLPEFPLERACSVYRNRRLDAENPDDETQQQFYIMPNGHQTTEKDYCDAENRACICTCDRVECAQGRQAWLERRRCSVQDPNQASYHRRWVKHNRVQDASFGGSSSDDEDILGVIRGPSTFANAFLYIGLGTISIGSIIFFVGTGEKGFKTQELRLIGPALAAIGLIFCIIRIMFCVCPSHCISKRERNKKSAKVDADHRTSLLGDTKRVSIARGPYINSKIPMSSSHSSQFPPKSIVKNKSYEGVEALRQIASTSLFLDNEQKINGGTLGQHTIPTIKEPTDEGSSNASLINLMPQAQDALIEPPIEMMKMETLKVDTLNIIDILSLTDSDTEREIRQIDINQEVVIPKVEPTSLFRDDGEELDDILMNEQLDSDGNRQSGRTATKLNRQRTSINQSKNKDADTLLMETSLMITDVPPPPPMSPPPFSPPPLPLSPNIVTTTFNIPSTASLTLPLTSTTATAVNPPTYEDTTDVRHEGGTSSRRSHHRHHHSHTHSHHSSHHHHKSSSQNKHRRTTTTSNDKDEKGQTNQITEAELVLSPSKLGQ